MQPSSHLLKVSLVVIAVGVTQCLTSQTTSLIFEQDSQFVSSVSLTWFSMNFLLLLAAPSLVRQAKQKWTAVRREMHDGAGIGEGCFSAIGRHEERNSDNRNSRDQPLLSSKERRDTQEEEEEEGLITDCKMFGEPGTTTSAAACVGVAMEAPASASHPSYRTDMSHGKREEPLSCSSPDDQDDLRLLPKHSLVRAWGEKFVLYALFLLANVAFLTALRGFPAQLVSAAFCAAPGMVLFLSWPVLGRRVAFWETISVLAGLAGVLLITQPWYAITHQSSSNGTSSVATSALFAMLAPVAAAVYKVLFARFYKECGWERVGVILSHLALLNVTFGTIFVVLFVVFGGESSPVPQLSSLPWALVISSALSGIAFNFLVNYGVTITFPLFVSVGSILSTVLNLGVGWVRGGPLGDAMQWAGVAMVISSLLVLIVVVWRRSCSSSS